MKIKNPLFKDDFIDVTVTFGQVAPTLHRDLKQGIEHLEVLNLSI